MTSSSNVIQRASGRWIKGESGNPTGRPAGSVNRSHAVLRQILVANSESVVMAVIKAAEAGDMVAARIILDRVLPKRLCRPLDGLALPPINSVADACQAMQEITNAVLAGVLSAEEATNLSAVIEAYRRTIEAADVVARLERLERLSVAKRSSAK